MPSAHPTSGDLRGVPSPPAFRSPGCPQPGQRSSGLSPPTRQAGHHPSSATSHRAQRRSPAPGLVSRSVARSPERLLEIDVPAVQASLLALPKHPGRERLDGTQHLSDSVALPVAPRRPRMSFVRPRPTPPRRGDRRPGRQEHRQAISRIFDDADGVDELRCSTPDLSSHDHITMPETHGRNVPARRRCLARGWMYVPVA